MIAKINEKKMRPTVPTIKAQIIILPHKVSVGLLNDGTAFSGFVSFLIDCALVCAFLIGCTFLSAIVTPQLVFLDHYTIKTKIKEDIMEKKVKIIFHIDLNAFYATCAMIKEPYLKHKVFVIGGPSGQVRRGVISTASYAARKLGIRSAMSIAEAVKIYPKLLVVPTDFRLYYEKSRQFIDFLKTYSDLVLQASIDEAYVDVTELSLHKHPLEIAKEIQNRLVDEYQLPCSIGIAPTLFLAKMGSDLKKPLGITVIRKRDVSKILYPLGVEDIHGIGKKTYPKLQEKGILTIGDFMNPHYKDIVLDVISENHFIDVYGAIKGQSSDVVDPMRYALPKSVSSETTFSYPTTDRVILMDAIKDQMIRTFNRLQRNDMVCRTVGIKLKDEDFNVISRGTSLFDYSDDRQIFLEQVDSLFEQYYADEPIRLVGVYMNNLMLKEDYLKQIDLFNYHEFDEK